MNAMNDFYATSLPLSELGHAAFSTIPEDFLSPLSTQDLDLVVAASVSLDAVSRGKKAPRLFQLKVMLSAVAGRDCVVRAATGSGKTLAMMLAHLIFPADVIFIIPFLKIHHRARMHNTSQVRSYASLVNSRH